MERSQRTYSQLQTVGSSHDSLPCLGSHRYVPPPPPLDICHCHSNSWVVIILESPAARAPSTLTPMIQKGGLFLWYGEECKGGEKGEWETDEMWFPLRVVSHEHEGGTQTEREKTILGWLLWQHNKQGGRYVQGCFHSNAQCVCG